MTQNPEMLKQGLDMSVITDWTKLRDWEIEQLKRKRHADAWLEWARRQGIIYDCSISPWGWAAMVFCTITDGFETEAQAKDWLMAKLIKGVPREEG